MDQIWPFELFNACFRSYCEQFICSNHFFLNLNPNVIDVVYDSHIKVKFRSGSIFFFLKMFHLEICHIMKVKWDANVHCRSKLLLNFILLDCEKIQEQWKAILYCEFHGHCFTHHSMVSQDFNIRSSTKKTQMIF